MRARYADVLYGKRFACLLCHYIHQMGISHTTNLKYMAQKTHHEYLQETDSISIYWCEKGRLFYSAQNMPQKDKI